MNILHIIESLDPALGGPSVSSPSLATAQAMLGHNVTLMCYEDSASTEATNKRNSCIPNFDRVKLIYIDKGGFLEKIFASIAVKELEKEIIKADIVQLHGVWRPILLKACQLASKHNKKYIITPRGMLDPWSLQQSAIKKKIGLALGWRKALNKCYYIHALNSSEKDLLSGLNLKCDVKVFPNGFFESFSNQIPDKGGFYKKHPELNNRPYILFLSRLHYKKGLDYLADAFVLFCQQNVDIDLVVAGQDDGALADFNRVIDDNNLTDRVFVVGPIYGEEKFSALVDAFCFCLPSRQEGFSMAITEAMACSTPVVISKDCHFPEVEEYNAGYVRELNPQEISNALLDLAANTEKQQQYSVAAKELVYEKYLWEKIAEKVIRQY